MTDEAITLLCPVDDNPALAPEVSFRRARCFDVGFVRCMKEGIVDVVDGEKKCLVERIKS